MNQRKQSGFTLIELLIVVAIVAILSAVAIPNMLEAQTRAKVSRTKADLRSLAGSAEAFRVDNTKYPVPDDALGNTIADVSTSTIDAFSTKVPSSLTTPIAYISTRLIEPFNLNTSSELALFNYTTRTYSELNAVSGDEDLYITGLLQNPNIFASPQTEANMRYFLASQGPDNDADHPSPSINPIGAAVYDSTNGTVSNGDIYYWGPGMGFISD